MIFCSAALFYVKYPYKHQESPPGKMIFRLHIVRHAEGTHNPGHDTTILDPPLTERGIKQSLELSQDFKFNDSVGLVLASPLRRTLQTAYIGFQQTLDQRFYPNVPQAGVQNGANLVLEPDVQAHSSRPCDTGSDISLLQSEYQDVPWDILDLNPIFPRKEGLYASDLETLKQRGWRIQRRLHELFKELANTARPDIVVVTHGGFMQHITGDDKLGVGPAKARSFMVSFDQDSRLIIEHSLSE
ncbi:hypothetical protein PENANT_c020G08286 [Penicillium antarcticum]|uniref:Phosphoglycerate mutase-like protein n=1 Tax=Penicillium antarcticum TaxID=416450 RepID=A0A1V6Q031_9EURO|nr:uncharacterized protein N7508_004345 [Penicillium antarcticum]KAJ5308966.1 hypothetical protein N7508_004345 [Penicillium antarcticum]OQD82654.1 hypothetical protein PENANT_c020G08286 [Penicillium antarcticum]